MNKIVLGPGHNHTTERFKRQASIRFSDTPEPFPKYLRWLIWVWLCGFVWLALVLFIPSLEASTAPEYLPRKATVLIPPDKAQHNAFKACPAGSSPVWLSALEMQCLKEIP